MTKLSRRQLEPEQLGFYVNDLWAAFTLMGSKEDIKLLFKDLFTHTEYKMFAKRFQIARMLLNGDNYETIKNNLKVTDITIAKVSNILSGKGEGFRRAHEELTKMDGKLQKRKAEIRKNLESPFRAKVMRRVLTPDKLGELAEFAVKPILVMHKKSSAKTKLDI